MDELYEDIEDPFFREECSRLESEEVSRADNIVSTLFFARQLIPPSVHCTSIIVIQTPAKAASAVDKELDEFKEQVCV